MENIIPNPHDKFFKETFSRLEVTKSFIEEVFPKEIQDKMNLNSLKLSNASFIGEMLKRILLILSMSVNIKKLKQPLLYFLSINLIKKIFQNGNYYITSLIFGENFKNRKKRIKVRTHPS